MWYRQQIMAAKNHGKKLNPTVADYQLWVVRSLIGIAAPNEAAVAAWIVSDWIRANEGDYLERHGVTFGKYLRQAPGGATGKLFSMSERQSGAAEGEK